MDTKASALAAKDAARWFPHADRVFCEVTDTLPFISRPVLDSVLRGYIAKFTDEPKSIEANVGAWRHMIVNVATLQYDFDRKVFLLCKEDGKTIASDQVSLRSDLSPGDVVSLSFHVIAWDPVDTHRIVRRMTRLVVLPMDKSICLTQDLWEIVRAMESEGLLLGSVLRKIWMKSLSLPMMHGNIETSRAKAFPTSQRLIRIRMRIPSRRVRIGPYLEIFSAGQDCLSAASVHDVKSNAVTALPSAIQQRIASISLKSTRYDRFLNYAVEEEFSRLIFGDNAKGRCPKEQSSPYPHAIDEILVLRNFALFNFDAVDVLSVDHKTKTVRPRDDTKNTAVFKEFWNFSHSQDCFEDGIRVNLPFVAGPPQLDALIWRALCRQWERVLFE